MKAAGTVLMDQATTLAYKHEPKAAREREENARGDKTAYVIAAEKLGVGAGALYGALRGRAGVPAGRS